MAMKFDDVEKFVMALPDVEAGGYPAVLIELRKARAKDVRTALTEAHRVASQSRPRSRAAPGRNSRRRAASGAARTST